MSLKEELQALSKKNDPKSELFVDFQSTIRSKLREAAKNGLSSYKLPYRYDKIIREIEEWLFEEEPELKFALYTRGWAEDNGYFISWKD